MFLLVLTAAYGDFLHVDATGGFTCFLWGRRFLCCDICVEIIDSPGSAQVAGARFRCRYVCVGDLTGQVRLALSLLPDAVLRGHDYVNQ